MSVNIFGGGRNTASNGNVGVVGSDRSLNQRLILLSNKQAQKVNKSGDIMEGDLKLTFKPESSCVISWCRRNRWESKYVITTR